MSNNDETKKVNDFDFPEEEEKKVKKAKKKGMDLVEMTLPLTYNGDEDDYPVHASHNFKTYLIKRGEPVMVPRALKERFDKAEKRKQDAYRYSRKKSLAVADADFKKRYNL